jgi:hypothetical protein
MCASRRRSAPGRSNKSSETCPACDSARSTSCGRVAGTAVQALYSLPLCALYVDALTYMALQPEWWASNFYGSGKMNNYNMRAGDLFDPPTQTVSFARNSTSNTRLQGNPVW